MEHPTSTREPQASPEGRGDDFICPLCLINRPAWMLAKVLVYGEHACVNCAYRVYGAVPTTAVRT